MVGQLGNSNLKTKNAEEKKKTQKMAKEKKKSLNFLNLLCRTHITHAEMECPFLSTRVSVSLMKRGA
jgi:hypothetical protein